MISPKRMIIIGFFGVLIGMVVPFLIILGFLENTFLLNMTSYGLSILGLMLGVVGSLMYVTPDK